MTGSPDHLDNGDTAIVADGDANRLREYQKRVEKECVRMLDEARTEAARIIAEARRDAEELRKAEAPPDREVLVALADRIVAMGETYREAMTAARRAVERMAELGLYLPDSQPGRSGESNGVS
jgi:hypothetical protein